MRLPVRRIPYALFLVVLLAACTTDQSPESPPAQNKLESAAPTPIERKNATSEEVVRTALAAITQGDEASFGWAVDEKWSAALLLILSCLQKADAALASSLSRGDSDRNAAGWGNATLGRCVTDGKGGLTGKPIPWEIVRAVGLPAGCRVEANPRDVDATLNWGLRKFDPNQKLFITAVRCPGVDGDIEFVTVQSETGWKIAWVRGKAVDEAARRTLSRAAEEADEQRFR